MTEEGWKKIIINCQYNSRQLNLLSKHLEQCDHAKQILRDKGYGYTGLDIVKTVEEIKYYWI